jgi:hypothetical protein
LDIVDYLYMHELHRLVPSKLHHHLDNFLLGNNLCNLVELQNY